MNDGGGRLGGRGGFAPKRQRERFLSRSFEPATFFVGQPI